MSSESLPRIIRMTPRSGCRSASSIWAHAIDHFVLGIYPTVVIGLEVVYQRPYSELIALATAMFVAFGVFSLPAGWLADRWSRRNMMVAFFIGCGVALAAAAFAPNLPVLAAALFGLGVFAAIYHPVGMAMLIEISQARGPHARLQRRVRQSRRRARGRHHRRSWRRGSAGAPLSSCRR